MADEGVLTAEDISCLGVWASRNHAPATRAECSKESFAIPDFGEIADPVWLYLDLFRIDGLSQDGLDFGGEGGGRGEDGIQGGLLHLVGKWSV